MLGWLWFESCGRGLLFQKKVLEGDGGDVKMSPSIIHSRCVHPFVDRSRFACRCCCFLIVVH